ncbi:AAA domain-containing protein [Sorangium sp. So ce375]|uniref:AAA domain-containing protein n=1 Tax=Sorangium sp. So ce375 TaxID=3133306 RepID=UPI003F5BFC16
MKAEIIRRFVAAPASLGSADETSQKDWLDGLHAIVGPGMRAAGVNALRDRQEAAYLGLAEPRCALLLGPPGTGKTTVLAWMILGYLLARRRAGRPCRVLVTAFTRNAIHNVLEDIAAHAKTLTEEVDIAVLGGDAVAGPGVSKIDDGELATWLARDQAVVGMTTWGAFRALSKGHHGGDPALDAEIFDLVCLDEASQMKVGQALMALAPLKDDGRIVVAGDDKQLAPIGVEAWSEVNTTLTGSFYTFLRDANVPVFALVETFRLNAPLAHPPSEFFYDEYVSAEPVADRRLGLVDGWGAELTPWLKVALDPEFPVCILLHDGPPAATTSPFEAAVVAELIEALAPRLVDGKGRQYGDQVWSKGLAVVTPHRAQNVAIRRRLRAGRYGDGCTVETVDRIQGRERDAIVMSYGVSDPEFAQAEAAFLYAPERFNVAITRPRSKLIVVLSRRLLEVLPPDEDVFDAVRILREWVFGSQLADSFAHHALGFGVRVDVRLRAFDDTVPLPKIEQRAVAVEPAVIMTEALQEIDAKIRDLATRNEKWGTTTSDKVDGALRPRKVSFAEYRDLFRLGRLTMTGRPGSTGFFWSLQPMVDGLLPLACTGESVRANIAAVVAECRRGELSPYYLTSKGRRGVRDRFIWCDAHENDVLLPILRELADEHVIELVESEKGITVDVVSSGDAVAAVPPPPDSALSDQDFALLNCLEDIEAGRIELGVFEAWVTFAEWRAAAETKSQLATLQSLRAITDAAARLAEHGFVLVREGRVRSRMAELARELRYVKQRFRAGDQDRRPFLVRSLKLLAMRRDKPVRDVPIENAIVAIAAKFPNDTIVLRVLKALPRALRPVFELRTEEPLRLSGFQRRSLEHLVSAWLGASGVSPAAVITADTGAGKTEAACLPLLVGSAIDRLRGVRGTRAVLVYPRIRLAVNQAARLVRYAQALGDELGILITVGLQTGDVRERWPSADQVLANDDPWQRIGPTEWVFPFFPCPVCGGRLILQQGTEGDEADTLRCNGCTWTYAGWVGTKVGLQRDPPALFLPVTESLHQWLHNPRYGVIFGDYANRYAPPRALLADEIHLYAHIHGAQIGWTLRRLLWRCRVNGQEHPLAIGMSATLGDPVRAWAELSGHAPDQVAHIRPTASERLDNPRGREYFYFVQPEVESRGKDVAGTSATIQSLLLLSHGMRRRSGNEGGFRGIVFLDSIDKLKRLHGDYIDAEKQKELAAFRTRLYGPDPQDPSRLRTACCEEPETCERFREGECWYFAATDARQVRADGCPQRPGDAYQVCRLPVFSGTGGNVDRMIGKSDIVFATSTLEVGYDDPAISLVYQHYAPTNLASFVQRKGRGGRRTADRPLTGVTLSIHSPRDAWYFRSPRQMLDADDFRVPINMGNFFVQRGQALTLVLDMLARFSARTGWQASQPVPQDALCEADQAVCAVFGPGIYRELDFSSLQELWNAAWREAESSDGQREPISRWREQLPWTPKRLFDASNTPQLSIAKQTKPEDVTLGLAECAPGRVTMRWGLQEAHWRPPAGVEASWLERGKDEWKEFSLAPGSDAASRLKLVPEDVRIALKDSLHPMVIRPTKMAPVVAGKLSNTNWEPWWAWDAAQERAVENSAGVQGAVSIHHKTQARLQGFVVAVEERAPEALPIPALEGFAGGTLFVHRARGGSKLTGLRVTQAYWCSDIEIVLDTPRRDRIYARQVFVDPDDGKTPRVVGYGMCPEGIRISVERGVLDAFLDAEIAALARDEARSRWHHGQLLRYLVITRAGSAGLTRFEARQLADLCTTAAAVQACRDDLRIGLSRRNTIRLQQALCTGWKEHLRAHPQLTERRVKALLDGLATSGLDRALQEVWNETTKRERLRDYLRSVVLLGLLTRLRQLFVIHGLGDERNVIGHARVPIQYGRDADDVLTVCERGGGGDGTTRAFLERAPVVLAAWRQEGFVACPNAASDRVLESVHARFADHPRWRSHDPRDPAWVAQLAGELGLDPAHEGATLHVVLRLIYGAETIGPVRFDLLDLFGEVLAVRRRTAGEFNREPTDWELVSTIVRLARDRAPLVPRLGALLEVYGNLDDALDEGTLSPDGRLAELAYRLSAKLCVDGCPGCLQTGNGSMNDALAEVCTSRTILERFGAFVAGRTRVSS